VEEPQAPRGLAQRGKEGSRDRTGELKPAPRQYHASTTVGRSSECVPPLPSQANGGGLQPGDPLWPPGEEPLALPEAIKALPPGALVLRFGMRPEVPEGVYHIATKPG